MTQSTLSAEAVRAALAPLGMAQIERLAGLSGVPATTIYKIKLGVTTNPGIETVGKFWPHVQACIDVAAPASAREVA